MKIEDERFLALAESEGLLGADAVASARETMAEIERLKQPITLDDVLEIRGVLDEEQIAALRTRLANSGASHPEEPPEAEAPADRPLPPLDLELAAVPASDAAAPPSAAAPQAGVAPARERKGRGRRRAPSIEVIPMDSVDEEFTLDEFEDEEPVVMPWDVPEEGEGEEVPGFLLERELGRSLAGRIFLARHVESRRLATVKVIDAKHLRGPGARARFLGLADRLPLARGSFIVDVLAAGFADDGPEPSGFVAAGAIEGVTLEQCMETAIPHRQLLRFALGMARGLAFLSRLGLAHGSFRAGTVFLEHGQQVRVGGFELGALLRAAGLIVPDPPSAEPYRAPELAPGRVSSAGDVYAFGVTLYRAYTDSFPDRADPKPLSEVLAVVDPNIDRLVMTCLEPEPARRPKIGAVVKLLGRLAGRAAVAKG